MLEGNGIAVTTGVLAAEARVANAGFLSRVERGRPWLTLKLALTLDGRIATAAGESRWITGPEARRRRPCHADAPRRGPGGRRHRPRRRPRADRPRHGRRAPARPRRRLPRPRPARGRPAGRGDPGGPALAPPRPRSHHPRRRRGVEPPRRPPPALRDRRGRPARSRGAPRHPRRRRADPRLLRRRRHPCGRAPRRRSCRRTRRLHGGPRPRRRGPPGRRPSRPHRLAEARRFRLVSVEQVGADILHTWRAD